MSSEVDKIKIALEKLALKEGELGPGHPDLVPVLEEISEVYQEKNAYREACHYYERGLKILILHLTEVHPHLTPYFNRFIELNIKAGNLKRALEYWEKAALILEFFSEESITDFVQASLQLVTFDKLRSFRDDKFKYFGLTVDLIIKRIGKDEKILIEFYKILVNDYRPSVSTIDYEKELARLTLLFFGKKSCEFMEVCQIRSKKCLLRKNFAEALMLCQEALSICKDIFTEKSLKTVHIYRELAFVYSESSQFEKALQTRLKGVEISENFLEESPSILSEEYYTLGSYCKTLKKVDAGIKYLQKAIDIRARITDKGMLKMRIYYTKIADFYKEKKDFENVIFFRKKSVELATSHGSKSHKYALSKDYENIAQAYFDLKNYLKAIEYWEKCVALIGVFGYVNVASSLRIFANLASSYSVVEDFKNGGLYWKKVIDIAEENKDIVKNKPIHIYYYNLAICYCNLNQYNEALATIKKLITDVNKKNKQNQEIQEFIKEKVNRLLEYVKASRQLNNK